jgi:altered-inheritance-of-mitochondria protein 5
MGVTTGFVRASSPLPLPATPLSNIASSPQLGGFTLTSAILYLSISLHAQNRATQAALLRQQRHVLTNVYDPKELEAEPAYREVPVGLAEMAKDRWNRELESVVRKAYGTDWRKVRESAEDRLGGLVERIREGK